MPVYKEKGDGLCTTVTTGNIECKVNEKILFTEYVNCDFL